MLAMARRIFPTELEKIVRIFFRRRFSAEVFPPKFFPIKVLVISECRTCCWVQKSNKSDRNSLLKQRFSNYIEWTKASK